MDTVNDIDYLTLVGSMIPASIMLTYDPTMASYPQLTSSASSTLFTTTDASERKFIKGKIEGIKVDNPLMINYLSNKHVPAPAFSAIFMVGCFNANCTMLIPFFWSSFAVGRSSRTFKHL